MAKIIVDTCAFSNKWVVDQVIPDLLNKKNGAIVVYSGTPKWGKEVKLSYNYLRFISKMKDIGKLYKISEERALSLESGISLIPEWNANSCCDDEHIFAACLSLNVGYIITNDIRMCKCRKRIKRNIPKKLSKIRLRFSVILDENSYKRKKSKILR